MHINVIVVHIKILINLAKTYIMLIHCAVPQFRTLPNFEHDIYHIKLPWCPKT